MCFQVTKFIILVAFSGLAQASFAQAPLTNCGFNGNTLRGNGIGGTEIECTRARTGRDETLVMPLDEKLGSFSNVQLRILLDNGEQSPRPSTYATIEIKNTETTIGPLGSRLYYGGVCVLDMKNRQYNKERFEKCRTENLSDQVGALKEFLQSAQLNPVNGISTHDLVSALESGSMNGVKVLGTWISFDLNDGSL